VDSCSILATLKCLLCQERGLIHYLRVTGGKEGAALSKEMLRSER
jgi:hypothetical protein